MPSGVLVPLFAEEGTCKVLFTQRSQKVEHHKGQISFPGGRVDEGDRNIRHTVLREVFEEVGLPEAEVDVLGKIDDACTLSSNFVVHPLVGRIPYPYPFSLSPAEVQRLITVPLSVFHPENRSARRERVEFHGRTIETAAYEYGGEIIWGATARILQNLMEILTGSLPLSEMEK